jgi:hypothetical protein
MVFNATFNNISVISWRSVLSVEETVVPGEEHIFYSTTSACDLTLEITMIIFTHFRIVFTNESFCQESNCNCWKNKQITKCILIDFTLIFFSTKCILYF